MPGGIQGTCELASTDLIIYVSNNFFTDASGSKVKDGLVTVQDFNATIDHALGLPTDKVLYSATRRPFQIADKGKPVLSVFA